MAIPHFTSIISVNDLMQFQLIAFAKSSQGLGTSHITTWVQEREYYGVQEKLKKYVEVKTYKPNPIFPWPWASCPRWDTEPRGDVIIGIDADVIIHSCEKAQQYIDECHEQQCIMGTIAYHNPLTRNEWNNLASGVGINLKFDYQNNNCGKGVTDCPYYINNGVVMMPSSMLEEFRYHLREMLLYVNNYWRNYYFPQVAVTLAIEQMKAPKRAMPLEFNCLISCAPPHSQQNAAFLHYHADLTCVHRIHKVNNQILKDKLIKLFTPKLFI